MPTAPRPAMTLLRAIALLHCWRLTPRATEAAKDGIVDELTKLLRG